MNLLFITHISNALSETLENHEPKEINRRAQQNALAKRKKQSSLQKSLVKRFREPDSQDADVSRRDQPLSNSIGSKKRWPERTSLTKNTDASADCRAPSVRSYLDTKRMDPFSTGNVTMTPQMEGVFMHYFNVIMPVVEPVPAEREEYHAWLVPMAMAEPALMYALTGCMAYDIEQASAVGFGPSRRTNMLTERLQYRVLAIQALNQRLADSKLALAPSTLIAVHFLLWQEIFAGDECVHLDGVARLLKLRRGFDGVARKAIEAIMVGSTWRAVRTRTKPILPTIADNVVISQERFAQILLHSDPSVARQGEGLLSSELTNNFDQSMVRLLEDARIAWVCFEQIGIYDFPPAEKRSISIKKANIDHRLLSYPFDYYGVYRPVQEACRQAFVLYSNAHYNVVQPSSKIARCLVEDLKVALEKTDMRSCWDDAYRALLWVLFLGAHMSFGQRERPWFVTVLARVVLKLESPSWFSVRAELVRFYYSDRVFQDSFRKIWEEAEILVSIL